MQFVAADEPVAGLRELAGFSDLIVVGQVDRIEDYKSYGELVLLNVQVTVASELLGDVGGTVDVVVEEIPAFGTHSLA